MATSKLTPFNGQLDDEPTGLKPFDGTLDGEKPKENIIGDFASTVAKGLVSVPEALVGLADIPTGGRVGKFLENEGGLIGFRPKQAKEYASSWESDATKQARQEFDQAEGLVGKAQAALSNPRLIAMGIGESVPSMLAGGALARTAGVALPSLAGRVGLTAAGEGAVMAGSQAEQIRQQTEDGLLTGKQAGLAAATGVVGGTLGFLGGRAAEAMKVGDIDQMIARGAITQADAAKIGVMSRAGRGALAEGVFEELPQSLAETGLQNLALDRPFTQDMDSAAVMGTLTGGAMGAGAGVLSGMGQRPQAQPQPAPVDEVVEPVESDSTSPGNPPRLGFNPLAGTPTIYPDGTVALNSEQEFAKRNPKPSEAMGIDRAAGPLSRAAADAVDSGASPAITPTVMANPLVQAAQAPAPTPPVVDTASLKDRTTEELRGFLRNAQDTNIRKAISSELARRKREEMAAMPDPLQQILIDQPKAEQPRAAEAPQAVQSQPQAPQEQPRPLASLIGGRLTDTDAADLVGKTRDPLRGVIQPEPRETGIQGAANGLSDTGVPAVTGAGAGDTQRPSGVSDAGRVLRRPGKRAVAPADSELAQGGADRAGDGGSGTGDGTAALNGRPARWRQNALQAKKVARELGLNPDGKRLAEIVAEVDAFDARSNVQDTPQGTERVQAQAPADQAPEAARGDGAETGRVPDTRAGDGVRADGVEGYSLPEGDVWRDWRRSDKGNEHPEYEPSARQRVIMASVERAIDDGVFYHKEMTERVAKELGYTGPTDDGSVFKTDVYLARGTVEAKRKYANQTAIANELNLKAGDNLGTLIFNDFKVTTGVTVESVSKDGRDIKFAGKRGPARVSAQTQPESIKAAIDRAHEKGKRKDTYAEFVASRQQAKQPPAQETKPAEKKAQEPKAEDLPEGWTATTNGFTGRPVYRFTQDIGQPFAVVTKTDFGYEVQIRQGDKLVSSTNMNGAAKFEALDKATQMLGEAGMATHKDPGEKAEPATKAVVTDAMKTAAKNEETKPSEMRKWLLGEIDKALLNAPDRADYDEAVKRMGEKDAVSMFTGNGFLGKNAETGFVTFDVPGDGKFKVRNSVRGLLEFRKNVSASLGFKDSGQKTVKPEQNEGVRSGSGGQMAAITNMIEEGDGPAAQQDAPAGRTYLAVPFKDKDYAKRAGAKWDDDKKLWYADPVGGDGLASGEININLQQFIPNDYTTDDRFNYYSDKAVAEAVALNASARDGVEYEVKKRKHPDGIMLWSAVKSGEQSQGDLPTIPEGYKPAGEPFYRGGKQIQGYAPFNIGERVTMKDSAGQSGVIESLTRPDDAGVFSGALVKFDNGMEQIVSFGKLQAASAPVADAKPMSAEQRRVLNESLLAGTISVEDYMKATGLTDDDVGTFGDGLRRQAEQKAQQESQYYQLINKMHEALTEQMKSAMDAPSSTPPQRKAKQERMARIDRDRSTLDMLARKFEHPFNNNYVSKLSPALKSRFARRFEGVKTGEFAKRDFSEASYKAWAELLIDAANKKNPQPTPQPTKAEDGGGEDAQFSIADGGKRNLVALHNLTAENLLYANSLGGIPVPSIGITNIETPFNGFGDITLIAPSSMVDPEQGTPVFDRDAWTARFPQMNFKKPKKAKADAFYERMKAMTAGIGVDEGNFLSNLWESMVNDSVTSPDKVADHLRRYDAPRMAYARDVLGKAIKVPMRDAPLSSPAANDKQLQAYWKKNGERIRQLDRELSGFDFSNTDEYKAFVAETEAAVRRYAEQKGRPELADRFVESYLPDGQFGPGGFNSLVRDFEKVGKKEVDGMKLREAVRKVVPDNDPAYLKWVSEQVKPLFDAPTITVRGKQVEPTLDNIVDAMTVGATQGAEKSMTFGAGKTAAMLGKRFKSMAEIKADRNRIVSQEQESEGKKATDELLNQYRSKATEFFKGTDWRGNIDTWAANDASMEALAKAGKAGGSNADIRQALVRAGFKSVDQATVDLASEAIKALRNAATDYFEAKPQRAVKLNEFRAAVVPKGASQEVRDVLAQNGIEVIEFNAKKEGAREAAIKRAATRVDKGERDVLFSIAEQQNRAEQHKPASEVHRKAVEGFAKRLNTQRERPVVMEAVTPGTGEQGKKARSVAAISRKLFGREVVFVRFTNGDPVFNGAVSRANPGKIFLNIDSERPLMAVLGHELLHELRKADPVAYTELSRRLDKLTRNYDIYSTRVERKYREAGMKSLPADIVEELHADMVGDHFTEPEFWQALTMTSQEKPLLWKRVINTIQRWLQSVFNKMGRMRETNDGDLMMSVAQQADGKRPFGTNLFLSDIDASRNAVLEAFKTFEKGPQSGRTDRFDVAAGRDQTKTEAFKRWFKGSKVVDANGEPLVVYHGSKQDTGAAFDPSKSRIAGAFFFSADPAFASSPAYTGYGGQPGNVTPAYLSLKNPKVLESLSSNPMAESAVIEAAKADGFDGIVVKRDGRYIAFRPEQIKSAIGNNGNFDPDNADIRFSIADAAPNSAREVTKPVVQLLNDTFKVNGRLSWWHKTVGTPFNLAQRVPEFKRVFDAVQNFINDVSFYGAEAAAKAPKIIPKLETWKDLGKSPISAEDNKAIAAPIFEGTLVWMRDESGRPVKVEDMRQAAAKLTTEQKAQRLLRNGKIRESVLKMWKGLPSDQFDMAVNSKYDKEMLNAGVVWTDAELRNQFKLTDEQIGLYREFREATDKSLVDLALSDIIQYAGKDIDPIKDVIMGRSLAEGSEMVRDYLMDMAEANPERRNDLLDTANGVIDKANRVQQLIDRGYAPLQRFGRYTVYAKDENGEQLFFGMYENRWDAARATRQMRQQFPDATIETGMMSEEAYKLFQGISPETLEIFGTMLGMDSQADGATNEAFQQYLKLAKSNRSAMKRLIERKGIAGYSEDASRVLASFLYSNARQTASNLHVGEILNGVNDIPKNMGDAKDMAMKLARYTMDPQEEAQALRGLLFAQYLGGSIASAMINALQPALVTFPYLSQFVGAKKSATIMAQAVKDALKRSTGDARLDAALKKAEDDGIVSPQEIFQLMAQAQGKATLKAGDGTKAGDAMAAASNTLSRLSLGWGKVFSIPEQFNRRSTFIAAYRAALEKGDRNPAAFAEQAVKETQFVYNKGNRPQWARGSIGALAFTFRTYSLSYVELLQRMAKSGPEGRRAAMLMVGVLFLMAGAGGLPGVEDAEDVVDGIAQRVFGLNFQTRQKRQEWLAELFGEGGARFIENGLSGLPWSPTDVSGRLGIGNLIPGTGIFIKKQDYTRDVAEIAGPAADMTKRFLQGAGLLLQGEVLKAGEIVSPVAIRNMIQGGRMAATDQYTDARGRKVIDTTMGEAALKAIGFQPANVARVQDATRTVQQMVALNKIRESEIADKWAKAIVAKDQDGIMEAQQEMRDWNQANPDSPIRIDLRQIRKRVQALREDKATRIERTAPKEIRQEVRRELEGRA